MSSGSTHTRSAAESRRRLTESLTQARGELFENIRLENNSQQALAQFSARIDELVSRIFLAAAQHPGQFPAVVVALGGYGRRQLCPYSDVDLLVLFAHSIGPAEEKFLRSLLHPLWDLRLDLGHHVRQINDLQKLEEDNPEFALALLDARFVAGDANLYKRFHEWFHCSHLQCHQQMLDLLFQLIEDRHARFNNTLYQLEPNVKEAPGALWDLVAARWIQSLAGQNLQKADGLSVTRAAPNSERLIQAENFLLRVRTLLHQQHRRNQNTLGHESQEKVADTLGYPGPKPRHRVETFMSDYFRHARLVSRFLSSARKATRAAHPDMVPVPLAHNLERFDDEIRFVDMDQAAIEPTSWIATFRTAMEEGCAVSDATLSFMERNLSRYSAQDFFPTESERDLLLDFLRPRTGLYAHLSEMHDCGLLGQMFPEFQSIFCRVVRDFYHKYTVDEHTLLAVRNLERLYASSDPARERFSSILHEVRSPELLVFSLLFHDVGKRKDENHVEESLRMVQEVFRRVRLPAESAQMVTFLIENHLQMSLAAFLRDTEDAEVVWKFAALVGTEENLKMLCLMTLVDIAAVSPDTLTPWKEELIWQLYVDTYNHLTLAYSDEVIEKDLASVAELLRGCPADLTESEISDFLQGFPRRYLKSVNSETIYRHVRLSRDIRPDEVHTSLQKQSDVWELTVVTLDKPYLFSNISGLLSYFGMDILRGQAMTNPKGLVLDIFQFTDYEKFLQLNQEGGSQLCALLQEVVSGKVDLPSLLQRKERGHFYRKGRKRVSTIISFDNHYSQRYTILEIVAQNMLGLLYRISRVISRHGYNIELVLISTEGDRAIDVFHITGKDGKLSEPSQTELKVDLKNALEEIYEIDQEHRASQQSR